MYVCNDAMASSSGLTAFTLLPTKMYLPALTANWKVWPAIQLFNFRFVPLRFRVPFTSSCGIAWTLYLSLLAAAKGKFENNIETESN